MTARNHAEWRDSTEGRLVKRVEDPSWVYEAVMQETGLSRLFVIEAIRDLRDVVGGLVAEDFAELALPLIARRKGETVHPSLRDALRDRAWLVPENLLEMDYSALAATLSLDNALAAKYPLACWSTVLAALLDRRGLEDDDVAVDDLTRLLDAWLDTYGIDLFGTWHREGQESADVYERYFADWFVDRFDLPGAWVPGGASPLALARQGAGA
jgi:hypothetical protein